MARHMWPSLYKHFKNVRMIDSGANSNVIEPSNYETKILIKHGERICKNKEVLVILKKIFENLFTGLRIDEINWITQSLIRSTGKILDLVSESKISGQDTNQNCDSHHCYNDPRAGHGGIFLIIHSN